MKPPNWTFSLRLLKCKPDGIPLEHLGDYLRSFSEVLGTENCAKFKAVKAKSIGMQAKISFDREPYARSRLLEASTDPNSKSGKALIKIQETMAKDGIHAAEITHSTGAVIYEFVSKRAIDIAVEKISQSGHVDGKVTGFRGVDSTMNLYIRDHFDRDLNLIIKNEQLAVELAKYWRGGRVRLSVRGTWVRGEDGWYPENGQCEVDSFEFLDESPVLALLSELASAPGNGWRAMDNPYETWRDLRGVDE
jgi:hypothetical protein